MTSDIEKVREGNSDVIAYLETDLVHNALDIWSMTKDSQRYDLYVHRRNGLIAAHLSIYHAPEAEYVSLGGQEEALGELLTLLPAKSIVLLTLRAYEKVGNRLKSDRVYMSDLMLVRRGEERLIRPELAVRLSDENAEDYAEFGHNLAPQSPIEWAHERLSRETIFGVFDGRLVSVASVLVALPEIAVITGVETKKDFRRKGYGTAVVSAAAREALNHSKSCLLGVAASNEEAKGIYRRLGFRKVADHLWVDVGTGLAP